MKSPMQHQFSQVPKADIPRSTFNRSSGLKTTFDGGYLVPIFVDEALPGDTFNLKIHAFGRLATPIAPIMDNLYLETFFFAVPNRLVWNNWQKFNGEQENPEDSTDYLIPTIPVPLAGYQPNSIFDYMGLPINITNFFHSCLPLRAYNLIYNEWFRDQNLQDSIDVPKGDGPDTADMYTLKRRGKRHDYFTSALPWPQKGPAVTIPLGDQAPIYRKDSAASGLKAYKIGGNSSASNGNLSTNSGFILDSASSGITIDPVGSIYTDLSDATATTINALRQAFQLQKLYERDARGGTRYTEIIKAHFGVTSPDARLQRPEYLGGSHDRININPVAQTSSTDATTPQGNLAAFGTVASHNAGFTKSFTEHTIIIGLANVRADLSYQQGINRMWSRQTRFDFYWPALSHIGEQAVLNKEIYVAGVPADDLVFGYQERYAEYRYKPSQVTGLFRSTAPTNLSFWHLAQYYTSLPVLNSQFIEDNPPIDRVIATPEEPHLIADFYFDLKCTRPMPTYSVPGLIDHF